MRTSVAFLFVVFVSYIQGAPVEDRSLVESRFIGCLPIACFVSPCMTATCLGQPGATCRQGCGCVAEWHDSNGRLITC